jgi:hypothetical protein
MGASATSTRAKSQLRTGEFLAVIVGITLALARPLY